MVKKIKKTKNYKCSSYPKIRLRPPSQLVHDGQIIFWPISPLPLLFLLFFSIFFRFSSALFFLSSLMQVVSLMPRKMNLRIQKKKNVKNLFILSIHGVVLKNRSYNDARVTKISILVGSYSLIKVRTTILIYARADSNFLLNFMISWQVKKIIPYITRDNLHNSAFCYYNTSPPWLNARSFYCDGSFSVFAQTNSNRTWTSGRGRGRSVYELSLQ